MTYGPEFYVLFHASICCQYHTVLSKKFKELGYKIYSPSEFRMLHRRNDIKLNWFCDTITQLETWQQVQ